MGYSRSKQTTPINLNGEKGKLALSLKDRTPLTMWYYVQHPCGGWVEFDVRDIPQLKEWRSEVEFDLLAGTEGILPILAEKMQSAGVSFTQLKAK